MIRLLSYSNKYKWLFVLAVSLAIFSVVLTLLGPYVVRSAISVIQNQGFSINLLYGYLLNLLLIYFFAAAFMYGCNVASSVLTQNIVRTMRRDSFIKLSYVSIKYLDGRKVGDIISNIINDIEVIGEGLIANVIQLITGAVTVVAAIIFIFTMNYIVGLMVLALTPLSLLAAYKLSKTGRKYFAKNQKRLGVLTGIVTEMISNQKTVKAYSYEGVAAERFEAANEKLNTVAIKSQFVSSLVNPLVRYISMITFVAVGLTCALLGLPVADTTAFLMYSNHFARPFMDITSVAAEIQATLAAADRVFDLLDQEKEIQYQTHGQQAQEGQLQEQGNVLQGQKSGEQASLPMRLELDKIKGDVEFCQLSFSYEPDSRLITHLNLSIKSGQKVAIVGPTGAGKTTLVNLLMRFYDVDSGKILLDGQDISYYPRSDFRRAFGMVLQDAYLFTGTIFENIAYGKQDAGIDEVANAAKMANCYDFILDLPDGFDTIISDSLNNISKGQKQLVFIARIMLNPPPLLILDEATASIDTYLEARIKDAFDKLMKGRTSFVVAHRLSTIINADLILVMNEGNVIEKGTHKELMAKGGFYHDLYTGAL